jgi:SAM-dependent methyltransferase
MAFADETRREARLLANRALAKLEPYRRRAEVRPILSAFERLEVLEVGGPSPVFRRGALLPVYGVIAVRDAVNYASSTLWEPDVRAPAPRREFVAEATALDCPDEAYGGLLASHVIEHTANPLGALAEWRRVVAKGGPLLIVIPHRELTFDHRRDVTSLEHLRADERAGTREDDLTHVREVLTLHDPRHDFFDGDGAAFERRCWENARHRALHHHVFSTRSATRCVHAAGLDVIDVFASRPHHIVILARHPSGVDARPIAAHRLHHAVRRSPFASDRRRDQATA